MGRLGRGVVGVFVAGSLVLGAGASLPAVAQAANSGNPCDTVPSLPICDSALGALRDVTASWRDYQATTVQPIPISDYAGDPQSQPSAYGTCGNETVHGTGIPPSTAQTPPSNPHAPAHWAGFTIPAPPPAGWKPGTQYCVLRYINADFSAPCAGCVRLFVDYDRIPATDVTTDPVAPGSDGHWALRMSPGSNTQATAMVDGHSPNAKNLCSDKFFNPSPDAECAGTTQGDFVNGFDTMGLGIEGNTHAYHHLTLEGRYYNGPYYLAGNGGSVPLHWVHGFYMDLDLAGQQAGQAYYTAGYAGRGDPWPDTDQSYACLVAACYDHSTYSATIDIKVLSAGTQASPSAGGGAGVPGAGATTPNTGGAPPPPSPLPLLAGLGLAAPAWISRRRARRS